MPASPPPLDAAAAWPVETVPAGTVLVQEAVRTDRLYVLQRGAFDIVRGGVRVVQVREAGAFLGEMSALLDAPPTASVIAAEDSLVHVIAPASTAVRDDPALTLAIAQLLARRLQAVTAYLVDIKRQYGDTATHLALMDQVLARLMELQPASGITPGSERNDLPDY